jgi:hypothetical protein
MAKITRTRNIVMDDEPMTTKTVSRQRRWQLAKIAAGRCQGCGAKQPKARRGRTYCRDCASRIATGRKRKYHALLSEGRCVACEAKQPKARRGTALCSECAEKNKTRRARIYRSRVALGQCVTCTAPLASGSLCHCPACATRASKASIARNRAMGIKPWKPGGPGRPPLDKRKEPPNGRKNDLPV